MNEALNSGGDRGGAKMNHEKLSQYQTEKARHLFPFATGSTVTTGGKSEGGETH
jgi:hypothetical protein